MRAKRTTRRTTRSACASTTPNGAGAWAAARAIRIAHERRQGDHGTRLPVVLPARRDELLRLSRALRRGVPIQDRRLQPRIEEGHGVAGRRPGRARAPFLI